MPLLSSSCSQLQNSKCQSVMGIGCNLLRTAHGGTNKYTQYIEDKMGFSHSQLHTMRPQCLQLFREEFLFAKLANQSTTGKKALKNN